MADALTQSKVVRLSVIELWAAIQARKLHVPEGSLDIEARAILARDIHGAPADDQVGELQILEPEKKVTKCKYGESKVARLSHAELQQQLSAWKVLVGSHMLDLES